MNGDRGYLQAFILYLRSPVLRWELAWSRFSAGLVVIHSVLIQDVIF